LDYRQARYNEIRNIPQRTASSDVTVKPAAKKDSSAKGSAVRSGADLPGVATSKIDIDAKPIYEPAGKPITQVNIDEDLPENDKPWRRPGTDLSDYFNYGFDEFTWALYATKQETLRSEYNQDKIAQNNKKMFEDMNMMMAMGGMPGMPGLPTAAGGPQAGLTMPAIPGMEGIPPEMQAMMQQMMAQGIDPTQMDPAAMFASMSGAQAGAGAQGAGQGSNQNQAFGGQQGFSQGQNQQQMGYGYDQGSMNGSNRGNFRGRGRGHRNW
jgi:pre-mRNA 3'-end-processing factor FIP1